MVEWVLCLAPSEAQVSAELSEGLALLRMQAGTQARWFFARPDAAGDFAASMAPLLQAALGRPDDERVLCLAHCHLQFPDEALRRMASAVDREADDGAGMALCWGPGHLPPGLGPDYCTVRGLERYAEAMALAVPIERGRLAAPTLPEGCQVCMTTLGGLRVLASGGALDFCWLPGCFAHDFGHYHQGQRPEIVPWVPQGARRVLDVGGGEGHFLALLRQERGCETHLSEFSAVVCSAAAQRVDYAWPGDFMALDANAVTGRAGTLEGTGVFDCITFLDSLEHAVDPGLWLDKALGLLRNGGSIVGSVPNVGHWSVVADLLEGRWDYCPVGIHCSTHLRFFTRKTLSDLLLRHGLVVERLDAVVVPAPPRWRDHWLTTPGLQTDGAELDAYAFLFRARRRSAGAVG